ncbi:MAG: EI24 domain-containing protein [Limnohabitans sp.]|nr:EI24 domain-containing protein [Limnohabitans sp.]
MRLLFDSFWRALAYTLHARVMAYSLLPLALMVVLALAWGYYFWEPSVGMVREGLVTWAWVQLVMGWLRVQGGSDLFVTLAPLLVILAITPFLVVLSLVAVSWMMTPLLVNLVARRRFHGLERRHGASLLSSVGWTLGCTLLAMVGFVLTLPLWLIPPLVMVIPPLVWGWLTYRLMAFDALSQHATREERIEIMHRHRWPLLLMGLVAGYLGAVPSVFWASGALWAAAFLLLLPLVIWIYSLIFAFTSLWFAHYTLSALRELRAEPLAAQATSVG